MHFSSQLSYTPFNITKSMKIYFLGISGTFMGNLAQIAKAMGHEVFGCDNKVYPPMSDELNSSGINFFQGYEEKNIVDADIYVIGNAISKENNLLKEILRLEKKVVSGPEWLYQNILSNKKVIAVSGTHGKTTVTSMIAHALINNNFDPNYLIAGIPKKLEKSWNISNDEVFVIEADEYDTCYFDKRPKFFHYRPNILLINNIEFDHADIYENIEMIEKNFFELIKTMPSKSKVLINEKKVSKSFRNKLKKEKLKTTLQFLSLNTSNIHEENKLLAAHAIEDLISKEKVLNGLKDYIGVKRRFETIFNNKNFKLIDDFAHHPTAIEETIKMIREQTDNLTLIVELGSNSMKRGVHDKRLVDIFKNQETYTINASAEQEKIFSVHAKELTNDDIVKICSKDEKKKTILMCGNRNFHGFQKLILNQLIK
tara:strand:- start:54 stop:1334 length:1281 start_codon:yes stop_codon:yes gene_type:complete